MVITIVMALQLILLLRLSSNSAIVPRPLSSSLSYVLVTQPLPGSRLAVSLAVNDPTLFALANPYGFSGEAWLKGQPWEHQLTDWTNAPYLLKASPTNLGLFFVSFVQSNLTPLLALGEKTVPPALKIPLLGQLAFTQSILKVEGDLAQRPLAAPLRLPTISPYPEFLSNSVVQVMVDRAGYVLSHTLVSSSGSKYADQLALQLAKSARFQPLRGLSSKSSKLSTLSWGQLSFQWFTSGGTNAGAIAP
jgi:hypothetical protein